MAWQLTDDVEVYAAHVEPLLGADPVRHTISVNAIAVARARVDRADSWWGWWTDASGGVQGAISCTPPFGLLLGVVPEPALESLVVTVEARDPWIPAVVDGGVAASQVALDRDTGQ